MSRPTPSILARLARRFLLAPILSCALMVAVSPAPAAAPDAQGLYSSGGMSQRAEPKATLSDDLPRPATRDTGRKTG